jgi:hypothetical protein
MEIGHYMEGEPTESIATGYEESTKRKVKVISPDFVIGLRGASADMVETVGLAYGARVKVVSVRDEVELRQQAAERKAIVILLDGTMPLTQITSPEFIQDIYTIRLTRAYETMFAMTGIDDKTRQDIADAIKAILPDAARMNPDELLAAAREAIAKDPALRQKILSAIAPLVEKRKAELANATAYSALPLPDAALLKGKRFAMATTEKMAMSNMKFGKTMSEAEQRGTEAGGEVINCFIYGNIYATEAEARSFIAASAYKGDIDTIRFIYKKDTDKKDLSYADIRALVAEATGLADTMGNIGISAEASELGLITPAGEKVLVAEEIEMNGVKVVPAINSYEALFMMVVMPAEVLVAMAKDGKLPPGVSYDDIKKIFNYLPKIRPLDYGTELRTYWDAIALIRSAA